MCFTIFVFLDIAFFVSYAQNEALIGRNGLLPADNYLDNIEERVPDLMERLTLCPTLFWFIPRQEINVREKIIIIE